LPGRIYAFCPAKIFGERSSAKIAYYDLRNTHKKFGAFIHSVTIMPKKDIKQPDYYTHRVTLSFMHT